MKPKAKRRRRRTVRGWTHSRISGTMSMGARAERLLASRLVELERLLDTPTPELWREYYRALDLWLRVRTPRDSGPPITRAQLTERFKR
jgi:hypothetical protein